MSDDFEIQEVWWHFEDQLKPSNCQLIRQVMDIYTNESILRIDNEEEDLFDLKIIGRNFFNNEIAFVYDKEFIINLGSLNNWPRVMDNIRHVKLEVRYGQPKPGFKFNMLKFWQRYKGSIMINWRVKPEFFITIPLGMEIPNSGKNLELRLDRLTNERADRWKLKIKDPIVLKNDNKRQYKYYIEEKSYDIVKDIFSKSPKECDIKFRASYDVYYEKKFFIIPIFSILLSIVAIYSVYLSYNLYLLNNSDSNFNIQLIVVLLSILALTLSLHKEGYEIPLTPILYFSIFVTVLGIILAPTVGIWGHYLP